MSELIKKLEAAESQMKMGVHSPGHIAAIREAIEALKEKEPELDWNEAKENLDFFEEEYKNLPAFTGIFGLTIIRELKKRYESGERTQQLYDEMMGVE